MGTVYHADSGSTTWFSYEPGQTHERGSVGHPATGKKSSAEEDFDHKCGIEIGEEEARFKAGVLCLVVRVFFDNLVRDALGERESQLSGDSQVFGGDLIPDTAIVFVEGDIQNPMTAVFDPSFVLQVMMKMGMVADIRSNQLHFI